MKKIVLLLTFTFLLTNVFGQVKVWERSETGSKTKIERKKAKGIYCKLYPLESQSVQKSALIAYTIAAKLAPYLVPTGNSLLKNATKRNPLNYNCELTCFESLRINIPEKIENNSISIFKLQEIYYPKGDTGSILLGDYVFNLSFVDSQKIIIKCNEVVDYGLPIKTKKNFDFIIETFEFSMTGYANALSNKKGQKQNNVKKTINLGTNKVVRVIPNYRSKNPKPKINTEAIFLVPINDNTNKIEELSDILINCKATYLNPYGLTSSELNSFLETNSDANVGLLKYILVGNTGE